MVACNILTLLRIFQVNQSYQVYLIFYSPSTGNITCKYLHACKIIKRVFRVFTHKFWSKWKWKKYPEIPAFQRLYNLYPLMMPCTLHARIWQSMKNLIMLLLNTYHSVEKLCVYVLYFTRKLFCVRTSDWNSQEKLLCLLLDSILLSSLSPPEKLSRPGFYKVINDVNIGKK